MKKFILLPKTFIFFLCICCLTLFNGCTTKRYMSNDKIDENILARKPVLVSYNQTLWILGNTTVSNDRIEGEIQPNTFAYGPRKIVKIILRNDSNLITKDNKLSVPIENITRIEYFKYDPGKTILFSLGVAAVTAGAIGLIVYLTKESCPFVYTHNGSEYVFEGEIYSGATNVPMERHDYLCLPNISPSDSQYLLKITNEANEKQHTNLAELLVIDHAPGTSVLIDKYGTATSFSKPVSPIEAFGYDNNQVLSSITLKDNISYSGKPQKNNQQTFDNLTLTFEKPDNAQKAQLVIRAKNSFWLDYTYGRFLNLFGNRLDSWEKKQNGKDKSEIESWCLSQGIPLSVYIEENNQWRFIDFFNVAGPMAYKDDIMQIDLSKHNEKNIRLKLESGWLFWEIDYAGMDFSENNNLNIQRVGIDKATDQNKKEVHEYLLFDDNQYLNQPNFNDYVLLSFPVPKMKDGDQRTVFLHSKGNYEINQKSKGAPHIAKLKKFKEARSFTKFSKENYLTALKKYSTK
ncbi:MAG: hypothetical protein Q8859_01385 [Bacteroidota bacterium]|nr:hypothetical protein [Bacteroidota bacterium]